MGRNAERIYTDPAAVARLESLIAILPNGAHVALELDDQTEVRGIVAARPMLQLFLDPAGDEGHNGVVRLETFEPGRFDVAGMRDLWLDRIVSIRDLGPH